jgi:hypothetical protein
MILTLSEKELEPCAVFLYRADDARPSLTRRDKKRHRTRMGARLVFGEKEAKTLINQSFWDSKPDDNCSNDGGANPSPQTQR